MIWRNLKINRCPKCNKDLVKGLTQKDGILEHKCGFRIREVRMREIVADQVERQLTLNEEENVYE